MFFFLPVPSISFLSFLLTASRTDRAVRATFIAESSTPDRSRFVSSVGATTTPYKKQINNYSCKYNIYHFIHNSVTVLVRKNRNLQQIQIEYP
jgi:hypothetical protein